MRSKITIAREIVRERRQKEEKKSKTVKKKNEMNHGRKGRFESLASFPILVLGFLTTVVVPACSRLRWPEMEEREREREKASMTIAEVCEDSFLSFSATFPLLSRAL